MGGGVNLTEPHDSNERAKTGLSAPGGERTSRDVVRCTSSSKRDRSFLEKRSEKTHQRVDASVQRIVSPQRTAISRNRGDDGLVELVHDLAVREKLHRILSTRDALARTPTYGVEARLGFELVRSRRRLFGRSGQPRRAACLGVLEEIRRKRVSNWGRPIKSQIVNARESATGVACLQAG